MTIAVNTAHALRNIIFFYSYFKENNIIVAKDVITFDPQCVNSNWVFRL